MTKIYVPANSPEDWQKLLADPIKHWRPGYSAMALAYAWMEDQNEFPVSVRSVFASSQFEVFRAIEMLVAFPEHKTPLPGGRRPSQSDVFVLARSMENLVSITVEGKVSEEFDKVVAERKEPPTKGKRLRLQYLCDCLGLNPADVGGIRYQLLHRTVSALIEADKFNASYALMMVHSFSQTDDSFEDFGQFAMLFNVKAEVNSIVYAPRSLHRHPKFKEIDLYLVPAGIAVDRIPITGNRTVQVLDKKNRAPEVSGGNLYELVVYSNLVGWLGGSLCSC